MQIVFFPWLRLNQPIALGHCTFLPFKDKRGAVPTLLRELARSLKIILRGYVDISGKPIQNCIVVTHADRRPAWNLQDEDHEVISRYTQILLLSAIAKNDYNTNIGCYTNTTTFQ